MLCAPCTAQTPWRKSWVPSHPQREKSPLWAWRRTSSMGWVSRHWYFPQTWHVSLTSPDIWKWHFSVFADIDISLCFLLQASRSWAETTLAVQIPAPSSAPSLPGAPLMSMGVSNLVGCSIFLLCGCENRFFCIFLCSFSDFPSPVQVTAYSLWMTSTSRASLIPLQWTSCRTLRMMSPWWCRSPKRGSTKVKEASWLLFVSSLKNPQETLFPILNFSELKKRQALKSHTHNMEKGCTEGLMPYVTWQMAERLGLQSKVN